MSSLRRVILAFSVLATGCNGSHPATPSASTTVSSSASHASPPEASPTPAVAVAGADAAATASPQFTLSGPQDPLNCFSVPASPMQWQLSVSDAGPSPLPFVALAHQDETPGCGATVKNPRSRVVIGCTTDYAAHTSGQTTFALDPKMYACGRVQVDDSALDAAGHDTLLVGTVINYGTPCVVPPPLSCRQGYISSPPGVPATLLASGGTGEYRWSTPEAVPSEGTGNSLTTNYWRIGAYTATVTSGEQTATCQVAAFPLTNCNRLQPLHHVPVPDVIARHLSRHAVLCLQLRMRVIELPQPSATARQTLQRLAASHAVLRTKDVSAMGIHTGELTRMVRRGTLERIGPGRYRRPAAGRGGEHLDLIVAVNAVPNAAVCLLSALQFHGIGTQLPHQIWLSVPRGTRTPRLTQPPLRIVNLSPDLFELGLESHRIGGATVRVYSVARTIVDCFRFRNRVGLDVALEALSDGWRGKRFTMDQLTRIARRLRVLRVMQPYLDAIAL